MPVAARPPLPARRVAPLALAALLVLAAIAISALLISGTGDSGRSGSGHSGSAPPAQQPAAAPAKPSVGPLPPGGGLPGTGTHSSRPNIVFVLTDDLSLNLLRYMPQVQAMQHQGLNFGNYYVSDSLCCPSRSSILTGNFPHDTHVFNNVGASGGFDVFHDRGEEQHTFAVALHKSGYLTAMMGKYLNGYLQKPGGDPTLNPRYIPPGWSEWDVAGFGYHEYDYLLNHNGRIVRYGSSPEDYLTDVIARKGERFIARAAAERRPFFLELATFAPHAPYTPAPADIATFPGLTAPRPPSFDRPPLNAPRWLADHRSLTAEQIADIDHAFRRRAQSVQAVDRMIAAIRAELTQLGIAGNTYVVFSSDNGLHTGEYRLMPGKMTAFDTDIHVPLVVVGPGITPGSTSREMTENIDLAETFAELGGTGLRGDGRSLVRLLEHPRVRGWRDAILVEHHGPDLSGVDPDFQQPASGSPRTYEALRTPNYLYVEYNDRERELYALRTDPYELNNVAPYVSPSLLAQLHHEVGAIKRCHDASACWRAMHVSAIGPQVFSRR